MPQQLFEQILGQLSTAVCVLTPTTEIIYLNSAAENILQISAQRALGTLLTTIADIPALLPDRLSQCTINLQPFSVRESVWIIHDHEITLDLVATPVTYENEKATLILELQVVDRILKISRDEKIQHSHQAHRALIRGLAHEVKNPLGAIRGASQLLKRVLHAEFHEYTDVIISEVDRLSKLVDSMLGPRTPLAVTFCNIHEMIEHVLRLVMVDTHSQQAPIKITIERHYDLSLPEFAGDKDRLIQALLNIINNARQALLAPERTTGATFPPQLTITTKIARQMTLHHRLHRLVLHLIIEDNGPGIPPELMLSMFYPLVSGRAEGSGIGLSIAQHVIQQHGGIIECESKPGSTLFHLYIPTSFLPIGDSL